MPGGPRWTGAEIRTLISHYPAGGAPACAALLPNRSRIAIYQAAFELGLKRSGYRRRPARGLDGRGADG